MFSRESSASALSKASQLPAEKPIPVSRTDPISKIDTVSKEKEEEEDIDNVNTAAEDVHDEMCTTPNNGMCSPDYMQVS